MYPALYLSLHNQVKLSLFRKTSYDILYRFHPLALSFLCLSVTPGDTE